MLALIAGLIFWYLTRQRRRDAKVTPSYASGVPSVAPPYTSGGYVEPPMKLYVSVPPLTVQVSD